MQTDLWCEFGIDYSKFGKEISDKSDKGRAMQNKLSDDCFNYIKSKYTLSETDKKDAINRLWQSNREDIKDIYILCNIVNNFDEESIKKYYRKKFGDANGMTSLYMLLKSFFEDVETFKKIHYSTLIDKKKLVTAIPDHQLEHLDLNTLDENNSERYAKQYFTTKIKKNAINVWYVLKDDDDVVTIFIFKNCKSRAKIPSTQKRRYNFYKHSRPIILRFASNGNLLEIYAKPAFEQGLNIASTIISKIASSPSNRVIVDYRQEEIFSDEKSLTRFFKDCLDEIATLPFKIKELYCKPNVSFNDCDLVFIKNRDPIKGMINNVENSLTTTIDIPKISWVDVSFQDKTFTLYFEKKPENKYLVKYSAKTYNKEFKEKIKQLYNIDVVRKG
jgi:hypothetical protein